LTFFFDAEPDVITMFKIDFGSLDALTTTLNKKILQAVLCAFFSEVGRIVSAPFFLVKCLQQKRTKIVRGIATANSQ
jgi:hypothetical protein